MTDWIDRYAQGLSAEDRAKQEQRQHELMYDRLMKERAPAFFSELLTELKTQANELDQKAGAILGGVTFSQTTDTKAVVKIGKDFEIKTEFSLGARKFMVTSDRKGAVGPYGRHQDFNIRIDPNTSAIWAYCEDTQYSHPSDIVTLVLQEGLPSR